MIRPAIPCDAQDCSAIMRDWAEETDWFPAQNPKIEGTPFILSKIDKGLVWVHESPASITGFVALEDDFLSCLYVASDARGRGVGTVLLTHAKRLADHFTLWTFVANTSARRFYLREGLMETNRTDSDNDERLPDIEFTWTGAGR